MDEAPVWIPTVKLGVHERTGDFTLLRYGQKEGGGTAYVVGPLIRVANVEMVLKGLEIVSDGLRYYKWWPSDTIFNSELKTMGAAMRSKFIKQHRFVSIDQGDASSISIEPQHRLGRGWRGITGYIEEQRRFRMPMPQEAFYRELMRAFDSAT